MTRFQKLQRKRLRIHASNLLEMLEGRAPIEMIGQCVCALLLAAIGFCGPMLGAELFSWMFDYIRNEGGYCGYNDCRNKISKVRSYPAVCESCDLADEQMAKEMENEDED